MIALVDADSLLYKVAFAIEEKIIWNEPEYNAGEDDELEIEYITNLDQCYETFDGLVSNILYATECDELELVFTGSGNFRDDLPIEYKANRKNLRKPAGLQEIREYAFSKYPCIIYESIEADDYVVWKKTKYPDEYILCAIDKDVLYQTEGYHYNYHSDTEVEVTKAEAIKYAYYQTLVGDTSDGYKGCPGIGKVRAESLLEGITKEEELWEVVVKAFEKKKLTKEDAINTMRLANMHQFDGKGVNLWEPPCNRS
jgi:5'-3' exonuclease